MVARKNARFLILLSLIACAVAADNAQPRLEPSSVSKQDLGEWSETVDQIRGRLVAEPSLDSDGCTVVRFFLELQNLADQPIFGRKISVQHQQSFEWELKGPKGNSMPRWTGSVPWDFDGGFFPFWISIPARSTLKFPVSTGPVSFDVLQPSSALVLRQNLPGQPWHLVAGIKGEYFLSARFKGIVTGEVPSQFIWSGPLLLPPVRMPAVIKPRAWK